MRYGKSLPGGFRGKLECVRKDIAAGRRRLWGGDHVRMEAEVLIGNRHVDTVYA